MPYFDRIFQLQQALSSHEYYLIGCTSDYLFPPSPLQWLTGFSGSAGSALIGKNHLFFWTDARYITYAQDVLSPLGFQVQSKPPSLPQAQVLYHPLRHSITEIYALQTLYSCMPTPHILTPQNAYPVPQVHAYDAGQTFAQRYKMLQSHWLSQAYQACFLASDTLAWLLHLTSQDIPENQEFFGLGLGEKDGKIHVFSSTPWTLPYTSPLVHLHPWKNFLSKVQTYATVGCAPTMTPMAVALHTTVENTLKIYTHQAIKSAHDIQASQRAHIKDGWAVSQFLYWLHQCAPLPTEMECCHKLEMLRQHHTDYLGPSFPTIAGTRENSAIIHYHPQEDQPTPLKPSIFLVDSGGQYPHATTDITRTVCLGAPTPQQKKDYTLVLKSHIALARAQCPVQKTQGHHLDTIARQVLWQYHYDIPHSVGHGVGAGRRVHELVPRISPHSTDYIKPSMIFSNEPGLYRPNAYGIRLENLMYTQESAGFLTLVPLTLVPFEAPLICIQDLTPQELHWINHYHARVYASLQAYRPQDTAFLRWLKHMTTPLV